MLLTPAWRKFALTAHVTASVGWLGAVVGFLALTIIGARTFDDRIVESIYPALELMGTFVIVPFSVAALVTGVIQSLGTSWGLFRHYWVLAKLLITIGASLLLLLHMQLVRSAALAASDGTLAVAPRMQLVGDAVAATVVLAIAVALSVYKPQGLTPFGSPRDAGSTTRQGPFIYIFWAAIITLLVTLVVRHLFGGGMKSHF
jgi:hypothetical protein